MDEYLNGEKWIDSMTEKLVKFIYPTLDDFSIKLKGIVDAITQTSPVDILVDNMSFENSYNAIKVVQSRKRRGWKR